MDVERIHQPCPFEACGSSDAFAYNTQKMVGQCFACDRAYPSRGMRLTEWALDEYPLEHEVRRPDGLGEREIDNMNTVVQSTELLTPEVQPYRGVVEKTMKFYNVQTLVDANGVAKKQAYTYPSG